MQAPEESLRNNIKNFYDFEQEKWWKSFTQTFNPKNSFHERFAHDFDSSRLPFFTESESYDKQFAKNIFSSLIPKIYVSIYLLCDRNSNKFSSAAEFVG